MAINLLPKTISTNTSEQIVKVYIIGRTMDGTDWFLKSIETIDGIMIAKWMKQKTDAFFFYTQVGIDTCINTHKSLTEKKNIFVVHHITTKSSL